MLHADFDGQLSGARPFAGLVVSQKNRNVRCARSSSIASGCISGIGTVCVGWAAPKRVFPSPKASAAAYPLPSNKRRSPGLLGCVAGAQLAARVGLTPVFIPIPFG